MTFALVSAVLAAAHAGETALLDHVQVVQAAPADTPMGDLPTIVVVHGLGHSPEGIRGLFDGYDAPALLVLPRGPDRYGRGWAWFSRTALADPERLGVEVRSAADRLAAFIDGLETPQPPVLTGFSQGGMLAFAVAVHHPETISLSVPISGWLPESLLPDACPQPSSDVAPPPPIRAFHGTDDDVLPVGPTRDSVAALRALGHDVSLTEHPGIGHAVSPDMQSAVFTTIRDHLQQPDPAPGASRGAPAPARPGSAPR